MAEAINIETRDIEICKVTPRFTVLYERIFEGNKEESLKGLRRVLEINPALEAEKLRQERERIAQC